jgi:cytochrome c-type biogenesis protein CcmE
LTDGKTSLDIVYEGILPDLFAENEAAIATGVMSVSNKLIASQVLAKHDENYTPPELTETMDFIRYSDYKVQ